MNTLVRTLILVNPTLLWLLGGLRDSDFGPVLAVLHRVLGIGIVVIAGLIVLTAGPGRRSRVTAVLTALAFMAVVAVGCSAPVR